MVLLRPQPRHRSDLRSHPLGLGEGTVFCSPSLGQREATRFGLGGGDRGGCGGFFCRDASLLKHRGDPRGLNTLLGDAPHLFRVRAKVLPALFANERAPGSLPRFGDTGELPIAPRCIQRKVALALNHIPVCRFDIRAQDRARPAPSRLGDGLRRQPEPFKAIGLLKAGFLCTLQSAFTHGSARGDAHRYRWIWRRCRSLYSPG